MANASSSASTQFLPNLAVTFSIMLSATGISQLVRPGSVLELWRFPSPSSAPAESSDNNDTATTTATQRNYHYHLVHGLIRREAVRNVALGLVGLATWCRGDRKLLGCVMLCGCLTAFSDGLISYAIIGRGQELRHWAFLPFMLGTAVGLLGWVG